VVRGTTAVAGREKPAWLAAATAHSNGDRWRLRQTGPEEARIPV